MHITYCVAYHHLCRKTFSKENDKKQKLSTSEQNESDIIQHAHEHIVTDLIQLAEVNNGFTGFI